MTDTAKDPKTWRRRKRPGPPRCGSPRKRPSRPMPGRFSGRVANGMAIAAKAHRDDRRGQPTFPAEQGAATAGTLKETPRRECRPDKDDALRPESVPDRPKDQKRHRNATWNGSGMPASLDPVMSSRSAALQKKRSTTVVNRWAFPAAKRRPAPQTGQLSSSLPGLQGSTPGRCRHGGKRIRFEENQTPVMRGFVLPYFFGAMEH